MLRCGTGQIFEMYVAYEMIFLKLALMGNAIALGVLHQILLFQSKNSYSAAPPNFLNAFGRT